MLNLSNYTQSVKKTSEKLEIQQKIVVVVVVVVMGVVVFVVSKAAGNLVP